MLEILEPFSKEKGGVLEIKHITYVEGRGNLIIEYKEVSANELQTVAVFAHA